MVPAIPVTIIRLRVLAVSNIYVSNTFNGIYKNTPIIIAEKDVFTKGFTNRSKLNPSTFLSK